jgi:hypothetical protein
MTEATQTTKRTRTVSLAEQITKLQNARAGAVASIEGIDAQLPALIAQRDAELAQAEARKAIDVDGLPVGTVVEFKFGRAEKARTLTGTVAAFAPATDELPARYRITSGEGFDAQDFRVPARDVSVVA